MPTPSREASRRIAREAPDDPGASTAEPSLAHPPAEEREHCPQCGRVLRSRGCKLVCECGYFMSCSEF
jgi:hypothetical protein